MKFNEYFPAVSNGFNINKTSTDALSELDYDSELNLKNTAVLQMFKDNGIKTLPQNIIPSPLPRKYRTTTKRRVFFDRKKIVLHFGKKPGNELIALSELEPDSHIEIYRFLQKFFSTPKNFKASSVLNYIIIRGSYSEHAVIFNLRHLSGDIVRILKTASNALTAAFPVVKSIFLYVDESTSDYYLEAERPAKGVAFKKLSGSDFLALKLNDKKFLYSPTSFSQINESVLPAFYQKLAEYLKPAGNDSMMDLYCGYGLWSLAFGDVFKTVWGVELSPESIASARSNAKFHFKEKAFHYETGFVTADYLRSKMPPSRHEKEWIFLDPPRKGCAAGVLEYLISRHPKKIFHLFCGADEIVPALKIYENNNCKIEALIPFDFFPGTINIEMLAVISI